MAGRVTRPGPIGIRYVAARRQTEPCVVREIEPRGFGSPAHTHAAVGRVRRSLLASCYQDGMWLSMLRR
jgi:hypothetical protein